MKFMVLVVAMLAGRYPAPAALEAYLGPAVHVFVGRVVQPLDGGGARLAVEKTLVGPATTKEVDVRLRQATNTQSGAEPPVLAKGRRFVVFLERDGKAADPGAVLEVAADGSMAAKGIQPWGADAITLPRLEARIKTLLSRAHVDGLLRQLRDPQPMRRDTAVKRLAQLRRHECAPDIVAAAADPRTRRMAILWIGCLEHPAALAYQLRCLKDLETRGDAVFGLGRRTGRARERAIPELKKLLDAEDEGVRFAAQQALKKLKSS